MTTHRLTEAAADAIEHATAVRRGDSIILSLARDDMHPEEVQRVGDALSERFPEQDVIIVVGGTLALVPNQEARDRLAEILGVPAGHAALDQVFAEFHVLPGKVVGR